MNKNIQYHRVVPENSVQSGDGFSEFNNIQFVLTGPSRVLVKNSIRIEAELEVFSTGTTRVVGTVLAGAGNAQYTDSIGFENKIGAHSFFESFTVENEQGQIQSLQHYPRYCNMISSATLAEADMLNSNLICELRGAHFYNSKIQCESVSSNNGVNADQKVNNEFSIKPLICLNQVSEESGNYSFDKNGVVRINMNLARNGHALFGRSMQADSSYKLKNVVIRYVTLPEIKAEPPMMMNSYAAIKSSVLSEQSHIQARVPAKSVNAVVLSFIAQNNFNSQTANAYQLEKLPNIDNVEYLFQDSFNNNITYRIDSETDMLERGISSLGYNGHTTSTSRNLRANQGFIIGQQFDVPLDLSNQKFSVNINSGASTLISANPRFVYLYFLNQIVM